MGMLEPTRDGRAGAEVAPTAPEQTRSISGKVNAKAQDQEPDEKLRISRRAARDDERQSSPYKRPPRTQSSR